MADTSELLPGDVFGIIDRLRSYAAHKGNRQNAPVSSKLMAEAADVIERLSKSRLPAAAPEDAEVALIQNAHNEAEALREKIVSRKDAIDWNVGIGACAHEDRATLLAKLRALQSRSPLAPSQALTAQEAAFVRDWAADNGRHSLRDIQYENEALRRDDVLCLKLASAARDALKEAEAILGGEYGDQYGILMENIRELDGRLAAFPTSSQAEAQAPAVTLTKAHREIVERAEMLADHGGADAETASDLLLVIKHLTTTAPAPVPLCHTQFHHIADSGEMIEAPAVLTEDERRDLRVARTLLQTADRNVVVDQVARLVAIIDRLSPPSTPALAAVEKALQDHEDRTYYGPGNV